MDCVPYAVTSQDAYGNVSNVPAATALVVKGGVMGRSTLSAEDARALADMPPRSQVLAEIAGLFTAGASQVAGLLDAAGRDVAYAVQALLDSRGGAPQEPEEPEAA